jgi:hypothetical protein
MLINLLTRQVLNVNPKGCNQYSGTECTGYHGTRHEFDQFKSGPSVRSGYWFNSTKKSARRYAHGDSGKLVESRLKLGKRVPEGLFRRLTEYYANEGMEKPATYDEMYVGTGDDEDHDFQWAQGRALRSFRKAGYNSAAVKNPKGGTDYVVIKPNQAKIVKVTKK